MFLRALRFKGHPGIGDLSLRFDDDAGNPYPIVILAGANGTGKSAIFEALHNFSQATVHNDHGEIEIDFTLSAEEAKAMDALLNGGQYFDPRMLNRTLKYVETSNGNRQYVVDVPDALGGTRQQWFPIDDRAIQRFFGVFYSVSNVSLFVSHPPSITSTLLDISLLPNANQPTSVRSGERIGNEIAQLLVDINSADAEDLQTWVRQHPNEPPPVDRVEVRITRFRKSFEY